MSDEGVPCKDCGKLPYLHKYCGDNGSSFNGVMWEIRCTCGNGTQRLKSFMMVEAEWEYNQTLEPTAKDR